MSFHLPGRTHIMAAFALFTTSLLPPYTASAATILSNNLSSTTTGTEAATGSTWLTSSFGTDSSIYSLNSVTLLLANSITGAAKLSLYSDGGLQPGTLVGTLTSPSSYSTALTSTTFTSTGLTLASNSTYWLVLTATSGQYNWAWTSSNSGTGAGFQDTFGISSDAGSDWFTYNIYPFQFSVTATAATSATAPEPSTVSLFAFSCLGGAATLLRRRLNNRGAISAK